jgi:hypothetical protein
MNTVRLSLAASKRVLGLLLPEDLPLAAMEALEDGCDSPALRILAGLTRSEVDEAGSLFVQSLVEAGLTMPTRRVAALDVAREVARNILSGSTSPRDGSESISRMASQLSPREHLPQLDTFLYADSEWDDRPHDRELFEKGIVAAARDLASRE